MIARALLALLLVSGCTSDTDDDDGDDQTPPPDSGTMITPDSGVETPDAGPNPIVLRGACPDATRWGTFLVEAQDLYSLVDGKVADGVVPASVPELVDEEAGCRLLRRRNPFCNPPCMAGDTCNHDGTCVPYPSQQNVGTVSISGLEKEIVMEPLPPSNNYFDTQVPHPLFIDGADIHLTTTDGRFGVIDLNGFGFPLMQSEAMWTVTPSTALPLAWIPTPAPVRSRVEFRLNIDQHGNSPVTLVCDLDDDGSAEIPAVLIDALFAAGVTGFPNGALIRQTVDSQSIEAGCVELRISSPKRGTIEVTGHTPCTVPGPSQCPNGQTCDLPTQTCR